ncbi:prolyl oligopeptidase family serine peptidase [Streptomyces sp. SL13]|uniref:Prolyl oligopeptidase family serine peptidase n=1 Tax=Streptantibioticus silvisoli TaxID=2705255 RepID=A0AA90H624_9ACTN|nr:prolyl oligopeptidase family serine peptidase [Streptantibioticus silvisoli]MDI5974229.1 prolyl oligopeptidase family serine peptidase [Streptantibioticus silvisoli]
MSVRTVPFGAWESPIDAVKAASFDGRPEWLGAVGDELWWTAPRPAEGGRRALMRRGADGTEVCALPAPWNVRSRVIEYGGVPWAADAAPAGGGGPLIVFTHFDDQRLYAFRPDLPDAAPRPLTPVSRVGGGLRWADLCVMPERGEVWGVLEEFTGEGATDVRRVIAAVPLDGSAAEDRGRVRELTDDSSRFVTGPKLSPDRRQAVWTAWDHPSMPWDGTELRIADVGDEGFTGIRTLIGGPDESVPQAEWAADGTLYAVTDRSGWWNLHRVDPATGNAVNVCPREEEFGGAGWKVGLRWFAPLPDGTLAVLHGRGALRLGVLDPVTGELTDAPGPWTEWDAALAVNGSRVTGLAASAMTGHEIVELDTVGGHTRSVGAAHADTVDPGHLPRPVERIFTGAGGRDVYAHVYPPHNPDFIAPEGELPPYVVWVHGGPTSRVPMVLDLEIAYFTSRGIGVAEVNYGGSTGYGREYRNRLRERWGVVDVEDCVTVAEALVKEGSADPARLAIRGGSAGGWTTGAALTSVTTFACGAISYPILDMAAWAAETHDFESRYTESLVGPIAEVPERYKERSPVYRADGVAGPFVLLQGLADVICPPAQSERFLSHLTGQGAPPHAYLTFEGEGHGFRRLETIVACLEAELSLYGQVFGFTPPGVPRLGLSS